MVHNHKTKYNRGNKNYKKKNIVSFEKFWFNHVRLHLGEGEDGDKVQRRVKLWLAKSPYKVGIRPVTACSWEKRKEKFSQVH